jgi:hypothetical protein
MQKRTPNLGKVNLAITTYKDDSIIAFDPNKHPTQKSIQMQHEVTWKQKVQENSEGG